MVTNFLSGMFLLPFGTLLSTLLYYDARARKENYNETLLAEEMGYAPAPSRGEDIKMEALAC